MTLVRDVLHLVRDEGEVGLDKRSSVSEGSQGEEGLKRRREVTGSKET